MQEVAKLAMFLLGMVVGAYAVHWLNVIRQITTMQDEYEVWRQNLLANLANEGVHYRDSA